MILVDTSVWVEHFRNGSAQLKALLADGEVLCHPFIVGELACGNLKNRAEIISHLQELPQVSVAQTDEILHLIEGRRLMGKGLGYIDMHLLASALFAKVPLWTLDKRLQEISRQFLPGH